MSDTLSPRRGVRFVVAAALVGIAGLWSLRSFRTESGSVPTAAVQPRTHAASASPPQVHAEPEREAITIHEQHYSATFSPSRGLTYLPQLDSAISAHAAEHHPALNLKLKTVTFGKQVLYTADPNVDRDARVDRDEQHREWVLAHGSFEERYAARGDGVEQRFVFKDTLKGRGSLAFTAAIQCNDLAALPPRPHRGGGIEFCCAGQFAVRYGQITVRDALKHDLNVQPELSADGRCVCFEVPDAWLRRAAFPIDIDPLVGGDFVVSPDNPTGVAPPTVAPGVNNYLIAWDDYTLGPNAPQLLAAVVTSSAIVSTPIPLSSTSAAPIPYRLQRIESAFDGTNWIVVWAQDTSSGSDIRGAIISSGSSTTTTTTTIPPAGTVLNGADFEIAPSSGTVFEDPLVAFDGSDFLVAWTSGPTSGGNGSQIFYARVSSGGVVSTPSTVPARTNPPNQALYFLAPQTPSGDTLMIYRENAETPALSRATRIAQDGTLRDQGGISLFTEDEATGGFGKPVAAAFINSEWQVLSTYDQTLDSSVFLHHVSTAGTVTPPSGVFATMGLGPTGTSADSFQPAFAGASSWLFLRNEKVTNTVYHILGKRVEFDGTDQDPIPFQIDTATQGILRNGVAAQSGSQFLVTWLDGRRATTQPGDAHNIAAAFVDATVADTNGPALKPVLVASPTSGTAPLNVSFDGSGSTGSFDVLAWNFGDGVTSNAPTVSHTYTKDGIYAAQLSLSKGAYVVSQTVVISVGTSTQLTGAGTQVGVPITSSDGLVPSLFISGVVANLDFTSQTDDTLKIAGIVDIGALPSSLTGITGTLTLGSSSYPFTLDAKGQFTSDASQRPTFNLAINPATGNFIFSSTQDDLQTNLQNLGGLDANVHPAVIVDAPVSLAIGTFSASSTVGLQYTATQAKSGTAVYSFLKKGQTVSGTFIVTKFSAKEKGQGANAGHSYVIQGELVRPNGLKYKPSPTGQFSFFIGNSLLSLPAGQFITDGKGNLKFVARAGSSGLKKFQIQPKSGVFLLEIDNLPSAGLGGTGLPLSTGNDITNVDLNLSFQFDLIDGQLNAGRFIFITRKSASAKGWTLR